VPAKIVIGFDGTDSGEDALALGMLLAGATGSVPLVTVVHPQEYPIGVGRVDAEWVAYMHEQAEQLLGRARRLLGEEAGAEFREVSAPSESRGLHELAEQERAEMVVVGSSHRGPLGRTYPAAPATGCSRDRPARSRWPRADCASRRRSGWARSPSPTSTPPRPARPSMPPSPWPSASGPGCGWSA
jgi:nucleotide-binding universal stress UspA family protein